MRSSSRAALALVAATLVVPPLSASGAGAGGAAHTVGKITKILGNPVGLKPAPGSPARPGARQGVALYAKDVLITGPNGSLRFTLKLDLSNCQLDRKGKVTVRPAKFVHTSVSAAKIYWCTSQSGGSRRLAAPASPTLFTAHGVTMRPKRALLGITVKASGTVVVRVDRGVVVVTGANGIEEGSVVGRKQQVFVPPGGNPGTPGPLQLRPGDKRAVNNLQKTLPKITDQQPPQVLVDKHPPNPASSATATFTFSATEADVTFSCALDGSAFHPCSSPQRFDDLSNGSHTFQVQAADRAGNPGPPSSYTWTIAEPPPPPSPPPPPPPVATITGAPSKSTAETSAAFTFTSNKPGSTFECRLDDGFLTKCASGIVYEHLAPGGHTFTVHAVDAAGAGPDVSYTWTIVVMCFGVNATIVGTAGPDTLVGTDGVDVIAGLGGDDTIRGLGGDDFICGGDGYDPYLNGGPGNDHIDGGPGNDWLEGDAGDDHLDGAGGNDYVDGGVGGCCDPVANTGNDTLVGGEGDDVIWAADFGRATMDGGPGMDQLHGLDGDDDLNTVDGVAGNDYGDGGAGANSCVGDQFDQLVNCSSDVG